MSRHRMVVRSCRFAAIFLIIYLRYSTISNVWCNKDTLWQVQHHWLARFPWDWGTVLECYIILILAWIMFDFKLREPEVLPCVSQSVSVQPLLMPLTAVVRISNWWSCSLCWFKHVRHHAFLYKLLFWKSWLSVIKYPQAQCLLVDMVEREQNEQERH